VTKTTGKIVNGVLRTDPHDMIYQTFRLNAVNEGFLRGMQIELKMNGDGSAEGLIAGYEDLDYVAWASKCKSWLRRCGRIVEPARTLRSDTSSGGRLSRSQDSQCTAMSAAYKIEAVRAFIEEPRSDDPLLIDPL